MQAICRKKYQGKRTIFQQQKVNSILLINCIVKVFFVYLSDNQSNTQGKKVMN